MSRSTYSRYKHNSKREVVPKRMVFGGPSPFYKKDGEWYNRETGTKCKRVTLKEFLAKADE